MGTERNVDVSRKRAVAPPGAVATLYESHSMVCDLIAQKTCW